jgi:hypothetical protein
VPTADFEFASKFIESELECTEPAFAVFSEVNATAANTNPVFRIPSLVILPSSFVKNEAIFFFSSGSFSIFTSF